MNNLKIKKFNPSILEHSTLIRRGKEFFDTFDLNNGFILKKIKDEDKLDLYHFHQLSLFKRELEKKLYDSKNITLESIVKPVCIYMTDDEVEAYSVPKVVGHGLDELLGGTTDLEIIGGFIELLSQEVKKANKEGIYFPDLANTSNILFDENKFKFNFIDYDGLQVFDNPSMIVSSLMNPLLNPYFNTKKYRNKESGLITSSFDKASLYGIFLYYTTYTMMTEFKHKDFERTSNGIAVKSDSISNYCDNIGLAGTSMQEDLYRIFSQKANNYPNTTVKKLMKEYKLDKYRFIRK